MTYAWAHWLEPALRADPFVNERLVVVDGWQSRGRPASDFSFLPSGIIDHHTACMIRAGHDPRSCLNGIIAGREGAPGPISQLLGTFTPLGTRWTGDNPDPRIILIAAGRCNHAGTGIYRWGAPAGNGSSIGIEWCGPPADRWPDVVVELRERVDAAILRNRNWTVEQLDTHNGYARPKGRKIDQSGAWNAQEDLGQTEPWHADIWRGRVQTRLLGVPPQPTLPGGDMEYQPIRPFRVLDTREVGNPDVGGNNATRLGRVTVHTKRAELPAGTFAVAVNVGASDAIGPGYLTAWESGDAPLASCCNYSTPNDARNGFTIVELSGYGTFELSAGPAPAHAQVDIVGAFVR